MEDKAIIEIKQSLNPDSLLWYYKQYFTKRAKSILIYLTILGLFIVTLFLLDVYVEVAHTAFVGWFFLSLWIIALMMLIGDLRSPKKQVLRRVNYYGEINSIVKFFPNHFTVFSKHIHGETFVIRDYGVIKEVIENQTYFVIIIDELSLGFILFSKESVSENDITLIKQTIILKKEKTKY